MYHLLITIHHSPFTNHHSPITDVMVPRAKCRMHKCHGRAECPKWPESTISSGKLICITVWCPGPESNRHAGKGEGFSYHLQLSLLRILKTHL